MIVRNAQLEQPDGTTNVEFVLDNVSKTFPSGTAALGSIDLRVNSGEFISIVGPSGCGKSTLLRVLAGLVAPTTGVARRPSNVVAAFVFQEPALLPWLTVQGNAELLMELEGRDRSIRQTEAAYALEVVGLAGFEKAYPHELSGGMRMRLSLARAIALKPNLLLLDEPLAAVDELARDVLQEELGRLWALTGFAAVLVTHNVQEAVYLSQRVVVMSKRPGRIQSVFNVPFPFPRQPEIRSTPEFARLTGEISAALRQKSQD